MHEPVEQPLIPEMGTEAQPPVLEEVLPVAAPPMEPVQLGERIAVMDVLRGFALLGILFVNMQFYTTPLAAMSPGSQYWGSWYDQLATNFIECFCAGKFYILFSFLFGMGISIQLVRADQRGQEFVLHHFRRMAVLFGFGLAHAFLFWNGDVLTTYALVGTLFLIFLRRKSITLWICAVIAYMIPLLVITVLCGLMMGFEHYGSTRGEEYPEIANAWAEMQKRTTEEREKMDAEVVRARRIYAEGSFLEVTKQRAGELVSLFPMVMLVMWPNVLAMFLLGLWVGRRGFLANPEPYLPFFRRWRWPALIVGLAGNLMYVLFGDMIDQMQPSWPMIVTFAGLTFGAPALTFFYVSTIILWMQQEAWRRRLAPIGFVGRMALTNYLFQTLVCTTIFYSHGLGLYGNLPPILGLGLTVVIWLAQIPFSMLWLRYFRYGPMEWLWRTLTYGKLQPIRL